MGEWYKIAFGELYPLVYQHRDAAEASKVVSQLVPLVKRALPTLDIACGNGRYMCALAAAGVDVYGVDLSQFLLAEAVKNGLSGRVVCGDMRELPFADGVFGSAINMFTSFGYFERDEENTRAIAEMARVIEPGGAFVMDFLNVTRVRRSGAPPSRRSVGEVVVEERRELSQDRRFLTKRVRVYVPKQEPVEYDERIRLYTRAELSALLGSAGFDIQRTHGDYSLGPFNDASERLIFVCAKRAQS